MKKNKDQNSPWVLLSLLALIAASAGYFFFQETDENPQAGDQPKSESNPKQAPEATAGSADRVHPGNPGEAPVAKPAARSKTYPRPANAIDRAARIKLLAELAAKLSSAGSAKSEHTSAAGRQPVQGSLSKEYIQESIREILPMLKECFEMALTENPHLNGKIVVRFTIIADEEYGGLIEDSRVLDDTELAANQTINECFRETIYAMKIKAPSGGGRVTVNYPFVLRSAEPDGGTSE